MHGVFKLDEDVRLGGGMYVECWLFDMLDEAKYVLYV